jgi:hypothetical protein
MTFARPTLTLCLLLLIAWPSVGYGADDKLAPLSSLLGDWSGVGEGDPGISATTRHAERALDDRYIMVQGRSVYPKQEKNKKGEIHTQIDLWSYDKQRKLIMLRQFDNLGFVSTYAQDGAASTKGRIVLVSEHLENVPVGWKARYTYEFRGADEYHELFELDPDGKGFKPYVASNFLRSPPLRK